MCDITNTSGVNEISCELLKRIKETQLHSGPDENDLQHRKLAALFSKIGEKWAMS